MKKTYRKIYFWFIFIITVALIPILLLYSSGYRINSKMKVIQTGSIYIETIPEDVSVYINDELYPKTSPVLINNLLPNEYEISLKNEDSITWQKKLKVNSSESTFINNAAVIKINQTPVQINKSLFPLLPTEDIISPEIADFIKQLNLSSNLSIQKQSDSRVTILDKKNKILYVINTNNDSWELKKLSPQVNGFQWDNNNKKLLYYNELEIWIYDINDESEKLITRQSEEIFQAIWFGYNNIIFNENNKIKMLEIDDRDHRQCFDIVQIDNSTNLILDSKQKNLYYQADEKYWKINLF